MLILLPIRPFRINAVCQPIRASDEEATGGQYKEHSNFSMQFEFSA
jgi:hypothetical protein